MKIIFLFLFRMHFFWIAVLGALLAGCSSSEKPYVERPLTDLYTKAFEELCKENFSEAADAFDEVERQHPYSTWAAKAQLMSAYSAFKDQKFERAIGTLDVFISLHPSSPCIEYAYYLRALSYYTNIGPVFRDNENAELALQAFEEVIRRFPQSDYAEDARFKTDYILEHLASQDMLIGMHYMKEKEYVSAMNRFGSLILKYPRSILMPEALYRIMEAQIALKLLEGAKKTLAMLIYNFPKDVWTQRGRDILSNYAPALVQPAPVSSSASVSSSSRKKKRVLKRSASSKKAVCIQ